MTSFQDKDLNRRLKRLKEDVIWNPDRKLGVQRRMLARIGNRPLDGRRTATHVRRWAAALVSVLLLFSFPAFLILSSTGSMSRESVKDEQTVTSDRSASVDDRNGEEQKEQTSESLSVRRGKSAEQTAPPGFVEPEIGDRLRAEINKFSSTVFPIDLPGFVPKSGDTVTEVTKSGPHQNGVTMVTILFGPDTEADAMHQTFSIVQETMAEKFGQEKAEAYARARYAPGDALEKTTVNGNPGFFYYTDQRKQYDLFIVGSSYVYTLNSAKLSKKELVEIAESMPID